jgi:serine/threonine protein kinase|mmetsp:Transcript_45576/g.71108  ORF Transcript_45576/g.71108 Transcript_45576/m.71108 type:complete len:341 (-) Transcript_45576:748-1770(-)
MWPPYSSSFTFAADDDVVGEYALGPTIGSGSYGTVKQALKVATGDKFAIKIIRAGRSDKLRREIEHQWQLHHTHVVQIIEIIEKNGDTYIVMELVSGTDLFDVIHDCAMRNVHLPEDRARHIFQQLIAGVAYCHDNQIAHRDLKPENMLLDEAGNLKICDFGFSARMKQGKPFTDSCGSLKYAAPELLSKPCEYGGVDVDIWSCGVVLYALLCNRLPFDSPITSQLYRLIQLGQFVVPDHVSSDARDLIMKMLTVDRSKRISVCGIRGHPWFIKELPPNFFEGSIEPLPRKLAGGMPLQERMRSLLEVLFSQRSITAAFQENCQDAIASALSPLCLHRQK